MKDRIMRRREVEMATGLSRATIYAWLRDGRFPRPVALGSRSVGWRESAVTEWVKTREQKGK